MSNLIYHPSRPACLRWTQDSAEFAKIGKYYAVESMLVWDPVTQVGQGGWMAGGLHAGMHVLSSLRQVLLSLTCFPG